MLKYQFSSNAGLDMIQTERLWHTLSIDEAGRNLGSSPNGLSRDEVQRRFNEYGPNAIEEEPPPPVWQLLLHQFRNPLIYILLVAAVVTLAVGEYIDTGVILAVLILNAIIGFIQEHQAELSIRSLMRMVSPRARVVRNGQTIEIESRDLVPGDFVQLESGSRVPADMRLVQVTALMVDESLLTGESVPVVKSSASMPEDAVLADRLNMTYAGTTVTSGRAGGYVVATGEATELGRIAEEVRHDQSPETPLQRQMGRFTRVIVLATVVAASLAFSIGVARGESVTEMFKTVVAMAVAAVPEGLPIVMTVTLAVSVRRMASRNAIIRRLPAAETLGSTTVIGSDKTGTLTENRMTVQALWCGGHHLMLDSHADTPHPRPSTLRDVFRNKTPAPPEMALVTGVLANEAAYQSSGGSISTTGDPTEVALLHAAARWGIDPELARSECEFEAVLPFEPERRFSAAICRIEGAPVLFVKGAPEVLVGMCETLLTEDGAVPVDPAVVYEAASDLAGQGLRVLAMAYRPLTQAPEQALDLEDPVSLTLAGLQGMMDPPREGVREAITGCQRAGMRVAMITGDHLDTARAIARDLRIGTDDSPALTGAELATMDDDELLDVVQSVSIYARMAPEHKLRVVRALQQHGGCGRYRRWRQRCTGAAIS
ncbi:MAG: HAD-IC family P-type ATPase [Thermomicrobiales bacterium]